MDTKSLNKGERIEMRKKKVLICKHKIKKRGCWMYNSMPQAPVYFPPI
jgi:hypothetical protein